LLISSPWMPWLARSASLLATRTLEGRRGG
jgi:hypothetical protein